MPSPPRDIVILAVPHANVLVVLKEAGDPSGKVVVDITDPITADFKGRTIGHTSSAAEEIQKAAPAAHVVKAFNTIFAAPLPEDARPNSPAIQVFVAGNDERAKNAVPDLARTGGFEPVDSGPLSNARFIEPLGELNIHMGFLSGTRDLGRAGVDRCERPRPTLRTAEVPAADRRSAATRVKSAPRHGALGQALLAPVWLTHRK